jgi:hypothetical protein
MDVINFNKVVNMFFTWLTWLLICVDAHGSKSQAAVATIGIVVVVVEGGGGGLRN